MLVVFAGFGLMEKGEKGRRQDIERENEEPFSL